MPVRACRYYLMAFDLFDPINLRRVPHTISSTPVQICRATDGCLLFCVICDL